MLECIGINPSDGLEDDSFFYYNQDYNKIVAYVSEEENVTGFSLFRIGEIKVCLKTLQMLSGIDSDDWKVHEIIINSDTGNIVKEMYWGESDDRQEYELKADDWK